MKLLKFLLVVATTTFASAARKGCDIPISQAGDGLKFTASSFAMDREPERARLGTSKAWCAKTAVKYTEYLQVNLSFLRHVSAIGLQGAKWSFSESYVKTFILSYSIDGKKYKFYKSKTKSSSSKILQIFTGNTDAIGTSVNEIHPSFVAQYVRIHPLTFKNEMCMKAEVYGCNETVDCTHIVKLGRDQRMTISTPSYPLPYRNAAHCNWVVYLPTPAIPVSIVAMDFDVGGSAADKASCQDVNVKVYRNMHAFSKFLIGGFCNNSNNTMPRETKISTESLRISFAGGYNDIARQRGFSLLLWSSLQEYKTAKACWNSTITLDCTDAEQDIEVISAYYGRRPNSPVCAENGTTANTSLYTDACKAPDVLPKLQTICDYRNVCMVVLKDKTFPHRCTSGDPLEMFVVYQCNATKPVITTPPPTTTPTTLAATTTQATTQATTEEESTTIESHGATTHILAKTQEDKDSSIVLIAAVAGGAIFLLMVIIALITCVCCRKNRNSEKAELAKKGVAPSESNQSKVMVESDSLYEKIDELEMDPVRYEAQPNKYSPLHDARRGMSENPLYQSGAPEKPNTSYDVPNTVRYQNHPHHHHHHRPQSQGNPLLAPTAPETNYIDVLKSPEELPSNSLPMIKYLEPSKSPQADFSVTIPLDRYSDSVDTPTGSSGPGDDVYEAMDGSNA